MRSTIRMQGVSKVSRGMKEAGEYISRKEGKCTERKREGKEWERKVRDREGLYGDVKAWKMRVG